MLYKDFKKKDEKINLFIYLFSRAFISLGDSIYTFAISFFIMYETGSALFTSINLAIFAIVSLIFLPLAGVISDSKNKKSIVILGEFIDPLIFLLLFIFIYFYGINLTAIYITTALVTITSSFVGNAFQSAITELFHEDRIQKVYGYSTSITSTSSLIGPLIGGALIGMLSIEYIILLFAFLSLISASLDFFLKFDLYYDSTIYENEKIEERNFIDDFKEGIEYTSRTPVINSIIWYLFAINFISASISLLPSKMLIDELQLPSELVGILYAMLSVGSITAGLLIARIKKWKEPLKVSKIASIITGIIVFLIVLPIYIDINLWSKVIIIALLFISINISIQFINTPIFVYYQTAIPQYIKGRVMSMISVVSMAIMPIGFLTFGFLYDLEFYIWINLGASILIIVLTLILFNDKMINIGNEILQNRKNLEVEEELNS